MKKRVIYIDIDGTITETPYSKWGKTKPNILAKVKKLCDNNKDFIVIWSGGGLNYAKQFCKKYNLNPNFVSAKPDYIIDDNPHIRGSNRLKLIKPEEILEI